MRFARRPIRLEHDGIYVSVVGEVRQVTSVVDTHGVYASGGWTYDADGTMIDPDGRDDDLVIDPLALAAHEHLPLDVEWAVARAMLERDTAIAIACDLREEQWCVDELFISIVADHVIERWPRLERLRSLLVSSSKWLRPPQVSDEPPPEF
jgi:hypothetical protein